MSKGNGGGGAAPGGGSGAASGTSGGVEGSHTVPLPKNPRALNGDTAEKALKEMGYSNISHHTGLNPSTGKFETSMHMTHPNGKRMLSVPVKDVRTIVYRGKK